VAGLSRSALNVRLGDEHGQAFADFSLGLLDDQEPVEHFRALLDIRFRRS